MVIGKIKPTATLVAQFAAGVEVEAIQHEGKLFLPVTSLGDFMAAEPAPEKPKSERKSEPTDSASEKTVSAGKSYTKDELMEMESKELIKILKNEFSIDPDDYDGKNTNKKLRDLILDAQKNGSKKTTKDSGDEPAAKNGKSKEDNPAEGESDDDTITKVGDYLEEFDSGSRNKKKTISAICALSDDADEDKVAELVEEFESDGDADIDEMAEKIAKVLSGEKAPKKPSRKGKDKKEELVEADDLAVGDRVSVYWSDQKEWYDGEVESVKKGKVRIAYDDGTDEIIDPEVHTKIKRLDD